MEIKDLAYKLDQAALNNQPINQAGTQENLTVEIAYKVQEESLNLRYQRGEEPVGFKLGFTSKAKMDQMGVKDLIYGRLTNKMNIDDGDTITLEKYIHPRAEPEIAVLTKKKINKPLTLLEAKKYAEAISPAMEIIDSRYKNFKFSLEDVIADNCSSAGFVLGQWASTKTKIENLGMVIEINQNPIGIGSSAAILGNPWRSFIEASKLAYKYNHEIPEGSIILLGAATQAITLKPNTCVGTKIEGMGKISINIAK